jgi:hypothetical protein
MKRIIVVLLMIIMLLGLTACSSVEGPTTGERNVEGLGFHIIEDFGEYGMYHIYLVYDPNTMVEYLITLDSYGRSICPYYNSDGTVAIYNGK